MAGTHSARTSSAGKAAAICLSKRGERIAERIRVVLPELVVVSQGPGPDGYKEGGLAARVKKLFKSTDGLIFISATGIAVRMVAPLLKGKHLDPAVVVVDEAGRYAVSLVSGHLGGANVLARKVACAIGAEAVITTATDALHLPSAEDIAEAFDLAIEDVRRIKKVNAAILDGKPVCVVDKDASRLAAVRKTFGAHKAFTFKRKFPAKPCAGAYVLISASAVDRAPEGLSGATLVMRPRQYVLGIGCRRGVAVREVEQAVASVLSEAGISPLSIRNIASIDIKSNERGLAGYARRHKLPMEFFTAVELSGIKPPSGTSRFVKKTTGAPGVCEPAAMLSAGVRRLWKKKQVVGNVTVAVARVRSRWSESAPGASSTSRQRPSTR